jgi:hypothetical protein
MLRPVILRRMYRAMAAECLPDVRRKPAVGTAGRVRPALRAQAK